MRARWLGCLILLAATSVAAAVPPATGHGVVRTSTGRACTIVGTHGRDQVRGTRHQDVICGLGGNDIIRAQGGADIVDGGRGDDRIFGGPGKDKLYGGDGHDGLAGQGGKDTLRGGDGNDNLYGNAGNDRTYGEAGDDLESGDYGDDLVSGGDGDDDLSGGAGVDDVDGGAGFNVCDTPADAGDRQVGCASDTTAPVVDEITASAATVDVSAAAQPLRLWAHVTDDTGVKSVQIATGLAHLVSGSTRDGVWATKITVPRYTAPGMRDVDVFARDRVDRTSIASRTGVYDVIDTVTDQAMPVVQSLTLSTTAVDVRSAAQPITGTVHLTDDLAGAGDLYLCPAHAFPTGQPSFRQAGSCASMTPASGTPTDSTWTGTYVVPMGAPSGTWNFDVWVYDAAGNLPNDFWMGPDTFAANQPNTEPRYRPLPNGEGVFTVLGTT